MDKIGFIKNDIYNLECSVNGKMRNHDVELVTEYFMSEPKKNEAFYFKIERDGDDRFSRCFWVDVTSKRAYGFYGDVIVFDTTFNTNQYHLTFAPILRVKLKLLKDGASNNEVGGSSSQTQYMKDPKRVRCKERSKQVTGVKEKAMKRGIRHCQECGHIGHDIRQCPKNLNTS
ncbi:hypothetical protein L3X38_038195 [Prunus dulcis]|uniref:CCHC-type domain-containing protein n=1 Tax=Prunus dulcis TaxID=3755 RepID=A0AAD4YQ89_PRUDU|nr:hypothetical protein L3X38_038195 [Prunus dulcis]